MQSDVDLAHVLLADFNEYRGRTQRHHELRATKPFMARPLKASDERIKLFADLVAWCRERGLEPRAWVYGLFAVRQWVHPPKATKGCLMSERLIDKIKRLSLKGAFKHRVVSTQETTRAAVDPNRDIIPTIEARKASLLQRQLSMLCLADIDTLFGYHPKSPTCEQCPLKQQCAIALASRFPFDIIGLRAGTLSVEAAEEAARRANS